MSEPRRQGAQANLTGKVLEDLVASVFLNHGFAAMEYADYARASAPGLFGGDERDLLLKNVPYETIYGHQGKTEFLLLSPRRGLRFRIECKWQQSAGSVDEKFPYLIENCKNMPEPTVVILIDGKGYKDGALAWLKRAAAASAASGEKDIRVFDMAEFVIWANSTF